MLFEEKKKKSIQLRAQLFTEYMRADIDPLKRPFATWIIRLFNRSIDERERA